LNDISNILAADDAQQAANRAAAAREAEAKQTGRVILGVRHPEIEVQLTGTDGNVFAVIGAVSEALRRAGFEDEAQTFTEAATSCSSYDEVLRLVMRTVDVT